jgi:nitrous oxidase accessory protein
MILNFRIAAGITVLGIILLAGSADAATPINSCKVISLPGEYVLTRSIINSTATYCINITSNNVIFDGAGYTMDGRDSQDSYGVNVYNPTTALTNVTVKNLKASDWYFGINYQNAQNGKIINNTATSNLFGIRLTYSSNSSLINNYVKSNNDVGILFDHSGNNILLSNNANSNTYGIWFLPFSNNNILTNNNVSSNTYTGIWFNTDFLSLDISNNNTLINNTASSNQDGIILNHFRNSSLTNNNASQNGNNGFFLSQSSDNTLTNNDASSNNIGIQFKFSNHNTLNNNIASLNSNYGIYITYFSSNNTIYNNYFNNTNNFGFVSSSFSNFWNITRTAGTNIIGGPYLGGNVWAYPNGTGFSQTCSDGDGDGICDQPYALYINNIDYLPLAYR